MNDRKKQRMFEVVVLLSGAGKTRWFADIESGIIPDTVLHALRTQSSDNMHITFLDALPALGAIPRLLRADLVIATDTGPIALFLGALRALSGGKLAPRWLLIAVNTASLARRFRARPFRLWLLRATWRRCFQIVCLASFQKEDFLAAGVPAERIACVPLGIDAEFFRPTNAGGDFLLSIGRDEGRDYDYLLRIARHLPYPLRIITSRKNIPPETPLPERVSVEYDVPIMKVRDRLATARIVVVPTKDSVGIGSDCSGQTVVLESLAAGKAVCATPRPWMDGQLYPGIEYEALPSADPRAAAQVLMELWDAAEQRERLAHAGRIAVETRHTVHVFTAHLMALVQERIRKE